MKNIIGIFLLPMLLSGCVTTASSGTRTEYEDKMKIIEKDYRENNITMAEYIELENRADRQGVATQQDGSVSSDQRYP